MAKLHHFLFVLFSFVSASGFAQETFTISGHFKDKETGEPLPYANIFSEKHQKGASSDESGYYSIKLPKDSITLIFSSFGYLSQTKKIYLDKDMQIDVTFETEVVEVEEVVIQVNPHKQELESTQMSTFKLTTKEAKLIPAFMGEVDLLKTLQLKPGVQSGGEGQSGIYVRGGGPDQNLIMLDEALVYNPNHLFGFFSVFNSDAIKEVELYKGGFPSQFGGRLSSVVDIRMHEGNKEKFSGAGGIGVIASRLTLEAPIKKGKSSILISGRRTYFDIFTRMLNKANKNTPDYNPIPDYYFYDFNTKLSFQLGKRDHLTVTGYLGRDIFKFNSNNFDFKFNWGNSLANVRWTHDYNSKLYSNISLIVTDYKYNITNSLDKFSFSLGSQIRDYTTKADFNYFHSNKHTIKFGGQATLHEFSLGRLKASSDDGSVAFQSGRSLSAIESGLYVSDDWNLGARWKLNSGLRLSGFQNIQYNQFFLGLEPRFAARYKVNEKVSLKGSYARMFQYMHLVTNSGASLPTDMWYPANNIVKPQRSDQVAGGVTISLWKDKLLLTDEVYHKWMKRQIDLRDGADIYTNPNIDGEFVVGKGWSYGNEIYLEKKEGKTTGWIGYTLSWTWRQFDAINNGEKFHARYDRRHDISVVIIHQLSKRVNVTATWVYGSGNWISLPIGRMFYQNIPGSDPTAVPIYTTRNSFRMAAYHRLDLGLVWKFKPKWGESDLTFSIYNAYNRSNPYFVYFAESKDKDGNVIGYKAKQVRLFPIIPSVTYNFKF
jgi:hypothetical protein